MNALKRITIFLSCLIILLAIGLFSCQKDNNSLKNAGTIEFAITKHNEFLKSNIGDTTITTASYLLVSVKDESGNEVCTKKKVELYRFEDSYISEPFALNPGNYLLTEFYVLDENNKIIYATPIQGSELAYCVSNPLPVSFSISSDEVTKLIPEVISTMEHTPEKFGYLEASFEIIPTIDFQISVFVYNETTEQLELTSAKIIISDSSKIWYSFQLEAITNLVTINGGLSNYNFEISKPGYTSFNASYTTDSLIEKINNPIIVVLIKSQVLILQPGSEGKDAFVHSWHPDVNYGGYELLQSLCWTIYGEFAILRSYIEFDLSQIPFGNDIAEAKLSLSEYHNSVTASQGHSHLSGSNASYIKRVTSDWDESTILWPNQPTSTDINQVILPQDTISTQDYLDIDVTNLVQDMINNPESSYGFLIGLIDESPYRSMLFGSSDCPDASKRPKLVIKYR